MKKRFDIGIQSATETRACLKEEQNDMTNERISTIRICLESKTSLYSESNQNIFLKERTVMDTISTSLQTSKEALSTMGLFWKVDGNRSLGFEYAPGRFERPLRLHLQTASEQSDHVTISAAAKATEFNAETAAVIEDLRPVEEPNLLVVYDADRKCIQINYIISHVGASFFTSLQEALDKVYDLAVQLKSRLIQPNTLSNRGKVSESPEQVPELESADLPLQDKGRS
jgi:hypothetical protein